MKIVEGELPSFDGFLLEMNEMEIPSGRWIDYDLNKVDDDGMKIIWKMWRTHTPYDAELHMKNQLAHGSWVLQLNPQTTPSNHANNIQKKNTCNR
jgi:hypothetical protein